jgi:hypothetical protein
MSSQLHTLASEMELGVVHKEKILHIPSCFIIHNHSHKNHRNINSEFLVSCTGLHIWKVLGSILGLKVNYIKVLCSFPHPLQENSMIVH